MYVAIVFTTALIYNGNIVQWYCKLQFESTSPVLARLHSKLYDPFIKLIDDDQEELENELAMDLAVNLIQNELENER